MINIYWSTLGDVVLNAVFIRITYIDGRREGVVGKYPLKLTAGKRLVLTSTRDVCVSNLDILWHATDFYGGYFDCATDYKLASKCPQQIVVEPELGDRLDPDWTGCPTWDVDAPMNGRITSNIVAELPDGISGPLTPCRWNDAEFYAGAILKAESLSETYLALPRDQFLRI